MSLGKVPRSSSKTLYPLRASSMAVGEPAQRAPTTIASNIKYSPNKLWAKLPLVFTSHPGRVKHCLCYLRVMCFGGAKHYKFLGKTVKFVNALCFSGLAQPLERIAVHDKSGDYKEHLFRWRRAGR